MIEIETYLRGADGTFVRVEECRTPPADADYVEGAVRLAVNGVEIIGVKEWDYVDQLWAYIANMIPELTATGSASMYFPDQPIELTFRRDGSRVLVSFRVGKSHRKASVPMSELLGALRSAGGNFFDAMSALLPENAQSYSDARRQLTSLI